MRDDVLDGAGGVSGAQPSPLRQAVFRSARASRQGVLERVFAFVFDGLVYPQIWEDPVVDMEAMAISPGHQLVAITSGGCNVLSYLTADPARITAVDLNQAHLSLLKLKQAAIKHLPSHEDFALLPPTKGRILFDGEELSPSYKDRSKDELRRAQMIYQMADTALNPKVRISEIIGRPAEFYGGLKERR